MMSMDPLRTVAFRTLYFGFAFENVEESGPPEIMADALGYLTGP